jgi:hypothetical protein
MMEGISRYIHLAIVRLLNGQGMKTMLNGDDVFMTKILIIGNAENH